MPSWSSYLWQFYRAHIAKTFIIEIFTSGDSATVEESTHTFYNFSTLIDDGECAEKGDQLLTEPPFKERTEKKVSCIFRLPSFYCFSSKASSLKGDPTEIPFPRYQSRWIDCVSGMMTRGWYVVLSSPLGNGPKRKIYSTTVYKSICCDERGSRKFWSLSFAKCQSRKKKLFQNSIFLAFFLFRFNQLL